MKRKKYRWLSLVSVLAVLGLWQLVTDGLHLMPDYMLPSPMAVCRAFAYKLGGGVNPDGASLWTHIFTSLKIALGGYLAGAVIGVPLGVAMAWYKKVDLFVKPLFDLLRPIPPLAWIPLSILWFGLGDTGKFFIIFLGCFCFITVNTYDGAKNVDPELMGAARMLGANERQVFFEIVLPSSVPYIFAGLQIAVTAGWSAVVGAEMVQSNEGVGWMIVRGMNTGNTLQIMVGMVAIGIVGFILANLTTALERRLCAWNEQKGM